MCAIEGENIRSKYITYITYEENIRTKHNIGTKHKKSEQREGRTKMMKMKQWRKTDERCPDEEEKRIVRLRLCEGRLLLLRSVKD